MKKQTTLNAKRVKFTHRLNLHNTGFGIFLRRCSTTKMFFELLNDQIPNQLLYNLEEKECYFLNEDCNLFKLKFEPIIMKNKKKDQTTEEYLKELEQAYLKEEIKKLAISWHEFHSPNARWANERYNLGLLTHMLIDLLHIVKQKQITLQCGIGMCHLFSFHPQTIYKTVGQSCACIINIGECEIKIELNFEQAKYDLKYNDILLVGESIIEKEQQESKIKEEKSKKKFLEYFKL
jgi:hypothetical protein